MRRCQPNALVVGPRNRVVEGRLHRISMHNSISISSHSPLKALLKAKSTPNHYSKHPMLLLSFPLLFSTRSQTTDPPPTTNHHRLALSCSSPTSRCVGSLPYQTPLGPDDSLEAWHYDRAHRGGHCCTGRGSEDCIQCADCRRTWRTVSRGQAR